MLSTTPSNNMNLNMSFLFSILGVSYFNKLFFVIFFIWIINTITRKDICCTFFAKLYWIVYVIYNVYLNELNDRSFDLSEQYFIELIQRLPDHLFIVFVSFQFSSFLYEATNTSYYICKKINPKGKPCPITSPIEPHAWKYHYETELLFLRITSKAIMVKQKMKLMW